MLPDTQIQEELSKAYVHSIASQAGFAFETPATDYDSVDIKISAIGKPANDSILESPTLEIQAKATHSHIFNDNDELAFPLRIKNYEDLRKNTHCERIVVVYLMPKNRSDWVQSDHTRLELRHCAYWASLKGRERTSNKKTVTIQISKNNMFNKDSLHEIMAKISKGEEITNAL